MKTYLSVMALILTVAVFTSLVGAQDEGVGDYYLPMFVTGKTGPNNYTVKVEALYSGGAKWRWELASSVFFRDFSGRPLTFRGKIFTGEEYESDNRLVALNFQGLDSFSLEGEALKIGWMHVQVGGKGSEPFFHAWAKTEARREDGTLIYFFTSPFQKAATNWQLIVERGSWISILNPTDAQQEVMLVLWDETETSDLSKRGGPEKKIITVSISPGSVFSGFAGEIFPDLTRGKLEVVSPVSTVTAGFDVKGPLVAPTPVFAGP